MQVRFMIIGLAFLLVPNALFAQEVIKPTLIIGTPEAGEFTTYKTLYQGKVEARGQFLYIEYASDKPVEVLIAPFRTEGEYNPRDLVHAHLEPGAEQKFLIDVSGSPQWSPWAASYFVWFVAEDDSTNMAVQNMESSKGAMYMLPVLALQQFFTLERFQASVFHSLYGIYVLGKPVIPFIGIFVVFLCIFFFVRAHKKHTSYSLPLFILIGGILFFQLRSGIDMLRYTMQHIQSWNESGTFEQLGASYSVARILEQEQATHLQQDITAYVCSNDSDYYTKAVRYAAYPIEIQYAPKEDVTLTHVVVHHSDYTFENDILTCKTFSGFARLLEEFADGARLYSLLPDSL